MVLYTSIKHQFMLNDFYNLKHSLLKWVIGKCVPLCVRALVHVQIRGFLESWDIM